MAALQLTRKRMTTGIWLCAAITMVASAISGVTSFYQLQHDGWGVAAGGATALAVDIALWVVLTGDHQLELIGLSSGRWGQIMRVGTCLASVLLNCTAAWLTGHPMLVVLHAIIPLLLVGLSEHNGRCAAQFTVAEREAIASKEAAERAVDTPIARPSERIFEAPAEVPAFPAPQALAAPVLNPQRSLHLQPQPTTVTPLRYRPAAKTPQPASRRAPARGPAFAWLDAHHGPDTTASILAAAINGSPHTCKKLLGEWRRAQQEAAS